MRLNIYRINGIPDENCAGRIEARLGSEPGVHRVNVSSAVRQVCVVFDPDLATEQGLVAAIAHAGYRVVPSGR